MLFWKWKIHFENRGVTFFYLNINIERGMNMFLVYQLVDFLLALSNTKFQYQSTKS